MASSIVYNNKIFTVGDTLRFNKYALSPNASNPSSINTLTPPITGTLREITGTLANFPLIVNNIRDAQGRTLANTLYVHPIDCIYGYQVRLSFMKNGGTGGSISQALYVGRTISNIVTRTGYSFTGWYTSQTGGSKITVTPASSITLWAHWTANHYTIIFNSQDGVGGPSNRSVVYNASLPSIATQLPTKEGKIFNGYFDAPWGGRQYYSSTGTGMRSMDIPTTLTLYAQWKDQEIPITPTPVYPKIIKYIDKVILPKNEECIFVDKTWRSSPAYKITKANILNWNSKFSKSISQDEIGVTIAPLDEETHQVPIQYLPVQDMSEIPPIAYLRIYLTLRNDNQVRLTDTEFNQDTVSYEYKINSPVANVMGQIANKPVTKVKLNKLMAKKTGYEIYFVADNNFSGIEIEMAFDEYSPVEYFPIVGDDTTDFTFIPGHLYKIYDQKVKDCSNMLTDYTNGIYEKAFNIPTDPTLPVIGEGEVGSAHVVSDPARADYAYTDSSRIGE